MQKDVLYRSMCTSAKRHTFVGARVSLPMYYHGRGYLIQYEAMKILAIKKRE